jgi:hypothetical protein
MRTNSKLCKLPTGEWAIVAPGLQPVRIVADEIFELELIPGKMRRVPMTREVTKGHLLREGMHARFYDGREKFAKPAKETEDDPGNGLGM